MVDLGGNGMTLGVSKSLQVFGLQEPVPSLQLAGSDLLSAAAAHHHGRRRTFLLTLATISASGHGQQTRVTTTSLSFCLSPSTPILILMTRSLEDPFCIIIAPTHRGLIEGDPAPPHLTTSCCRFAPKSRRPLP